MKDPIKINLKLEHILELLKGKELHYLQSINDKKIIIYPPQGNITMTKDEFNQIKRNIRHDVTLEFMDLLNNLNKNSKENI